MEKCCKIKEMIIGENTELDLTVETNKDIESHISGCAECRSIIEDLKGVSLKIKSVERIKVSDSFDYKLKLKLQAVKEAEKTSVSKTVPFFNRIFYYSAGVAAMVLGFFYVSSLGVFDSSNGNIIPVTPGSNVTAEAETVKTTGTTIADSLENMRKTVSDDEELRLRVSTGE